MVTFSNISENQALKDAYQHCYQIARQHSENFPVASKFIPKKLRKAITVIYAFARTADDIADEGNLEPEQRLSALHRYREGLNEKINANHAKEEDLIFIALQDVVQSYHLPISLFSDLLSAFEQDILKREYEDFSEVIDYCKKSACPIGRLLLYLTHTASEQNFYYSDCICTALQLIDFLQDLADDLKCRDRCYLPQDELKAQGISTAWLRIHALSFQNESTNKPINKLNSESSNESNITIINTSAIQSIISQQLIHIESLLHQGAPLSHVLTGRFGFEFRLVLASGHKMIKKLKLRHSIFTRPSIRSFEWPLLILQALRPRQGKNPL